MKYLYIFTVGIMLVIFYLLVFGNKKSVNTLPDTKRQDIVLIDSLKKRSSELMYLQDIYQLNLSLVGKRVQMPSISKAFNLADTGMKKPVAVSTTAKKKLFIRYTSLGCGSCADLFIKHIKTRQRVLNNYEVVILADYADYGDFMKWYKISELDEDQRLLVVKKGDVGLPLENSNVSYAFTTSNNGVISSFFIPNKLFPDYVSSYVDNL